MFAITQDQKILMLVEKESDARDVLMNVNKILDKMTLKNLDKVMDKIYHIFPDSGELNPFVAFRMKEMR